MITRDIYHKLMNTDKEFNSLKHAVLIARVTSVAGALFAMVIALNFRSIIGLLFWTSTLQSGVLFAPMILGLFWKKANRTGAFASIICGAIVALLDMCGIVALPERMLVTMAVGALALIIGSIAGQKKTPSLEA
jgi:Na+/proline symporter